MWLAIVLLCIVALVVYVSTAPLIIEIDSVRGVCQVKFHRIAYAVMRLSASSLMMDLNVVGWRKNIDLLKTKGKIVKEVLHAERRGESKRKKKKRQVPFRKVVAVFRTFKVKECMVNIDTGDMPVNGVLFPVFYAIQVWSGKMISINFLDENVIRLKIRNNLARILWAYFRA